MKKKLLTLIFLGLFVGGMAAQEYMPNEILIKITKPYERQLDLNKDLRTLGIQTMDLKNESLNLVDILPIGNYHKTATFRLIFDNNLSVEELINDYQKMDEILFAEPNYMGELGGYEMIVEAANSPNDPYLNYQWGLHNDGSFSISGMNMQVTTGADVKMLDAWDIETGDPNMVIAVSDSGMRMTHEDIVDNLWVNPNETQNGSDSDNNGYVDDIHGWNWVHNNNNPEDDHGHGTNCGGIISAKTNNAKGYAGANWNSKTMTLKVLNSNNSGSFADMASSIYYAVDNGAKIISMSIGGSSNTSVLKNAVSYANDHDVILVACMMNFNDQVTYYPAGYSLEFANVIAVGSTDADDSRTQPFFWDNNSGSNYGTHINVVAPGNYIYGLGNNSNSTYNTYWGGTSQATPLVAGIASLVWAANPDLSPAEVRSILQDTADDQVGKPSEDIQGFDIYHGWGRVNAHAAVSEAKALAVENHTVVEKSLSLVNPVRNQILEFNSNLDFVGQAQLSAMSMDGRMVLDTQMEVGTGHNTVELHGLATGSYMFTLKLGDYKKTFKVIVQ